ncbi:MAG TPA: hypothetical protein VL485_03410 [Ktedonobacteraceae bacterium]|nr:hypothetical protein [Ktedonobacteraceae bacterium]
MQQETMHLTGEAENQQEQECMHEQIEGELSDAELAQIKGTAGTPYNLYGMGTPYNQYFERFGH